MKSIPVSGPSITDKEISYVTDAVTNAWYENANHFNIKFEQKFAEYIGVKHAITLPSCTSAIHLALLSLNIKSGDEVIVPDATWIASSAPITYVGATPVFADIDPESWCLSADAFEQAITPKTRAVIPVDLYGNMPDMSAIRKIANHNNIAVIEDAAEAFGSELNNKRAGAYGDVGVFSFHGSKTMTTGEGGMLVTDNTTVYERALFLRDHGRPPGDTDFQNTEVAYKYKMSSLQAALGLAQVERADELIDKKRKIFDWYDSRIQNQDKIKLNNEIPNGKNSYWMVTVIIDQSYHLDKYTIMQKMHAAGVNCRPFFNPLSSLVAYKDTASSKGAKNRNRNSYLISEKGINLPSGLNLTEEDVDYVVKTLLNVLET
jgi:perosamine synthetase